MLIIKKLVLFIFYRSNRIGRDCDLSIPTFIKRSTLEGRNKILSHTKIVDSYVGHSSFIGQNCLFVKSIVGRFCSIGESVRVIYGSHPTSEIVSTHPAFYSAEAQYGFSYVGESVFSEYSYARDDKFVVVGNDVWIGSYSHILSGVTIGDGAIVAANSVVVKDVPPYAIVAGVPARVIKYRFNEEQIKKLLDTKWWDKSEKWLKTHANAFENIELFMSVIEGE